MWPEADTALKFDEQRRCALRRCHAPSAQSLSTGIAGSIFEIASANQDIV
jgi:hypothetical protein